MLWKSQNIDRMKAMVDRTIKEIDNELDKPIKSDKWRNLYFLKSGESYWGLKIHSSLVSAELAILEGLNGPPNHKIVNLFPRRVLMKETSHAIPLPWKG